MHIIVGPKRRSGLGVRVFFAITLASLVGLSGIMNGMIMAEEPQSTASVKDTSTLTTPDYQSASATRGNQ